MRLMWLAERPDDLKLTVPITIQIVDLLRRYARFMHGMQAFMRNRRIDDRKSRRGAANQDRDTAARA